MPRVKINHPIKDRLIEYQSCWHEVYKLHEKFISYIKKTSNFDYQLLIDELNNLKNSIDKLIELFEQFYIMDKGISKNEELTTLTPENLD